MIFNIDSNGATLTLLTCYLQVVVVDEAQRPLAQRVMATCHSLVQVRARGELAGAWCGLKGGGNEWCGLKGGGNECLLACA